MKHHLLMENQSVFIDNQILHFKMCYFHFETPTKRTLCVLLLTIRQSFILLKIFFDMRVQL